jgi:hypothetical protein
VINDGEDEYVINSSRVIQDAISLPCTDTDKEGSITEP